MFDSLVRKIEFYYELIKTGALNYATKSAIRFFGEGRF